MNIRSLAEIGACLEESAAVPPGIDVDPLEHYFQIEALAIEILDSEFENYAEGVLEQYLKSFLVQKRLEMGIDEVELKNSGC